MRMRAKDGVRKVIVIQAIDRSTFQFSQFPILASPMSRKKVEANRDGERYTKQERR